MMQWLKTKQVFGGGKRNSGIELLKVIGIFLIVLSHVIQTASQENTYVSYQDYVLDLTTATTNFQLLILSILRYSGVIGNTIFFISSAWFLLDSKKFSAKKWFFMFVEVWIISIIILVFTLIERRGNISFKLIIKNIFPNIFANNWYLTCYLLFYPIHVILNKVLNDMSQRQHLGATCALVVLYLIINLVKGGLFFTSAIIVWVAIYFLLSYFKTYHKKQCDSIKFNVILFVIGFLLFLATIIVTNFLGLEISYFSTKLLYWLNNYNIFIIIFVIALFNLFRQMMFRSKVINYISSLSLLVYIIHENIILRSYYRPFFMNWLYETFGYSQVVLLMLAAALAIFVGTTIVAFIYDKTLRRFVRKLSELVHNVCSKLWNKFADWVIKHSPEKGSIEE